jgi:hypothetical protein
MDNDPNAETAAAAGRVLEHPTIENLRSFYETAIATKRAYDARQPKGFRAFLRRLITLERVDD